MILKKSQNRGSTLVAPMVSLRGDRLRLPRTGRGFTLIELMVSMAVGSVILFVAASMLGTTGDGYERVGGGVGAEREARALMTQLTADLSTACFHEKTIFEKGTAGSWSRDRLGFLSLQPDDAQSDVGRIGDLCAVNYYIKDLQMGGKTVRCLMRGFRESEETFAGLRSDSIPPLFDPGTKDDPVAFDVVSFEARPKVRGAGNKWVDWDTADKTIGPDAIEVRLVIARRELAGKFSKPADWDGSGTTAALLGTLEKASENRNLEIYGTLIRFGNHAPR